MEHLNEPSYITHVLQPRVIKWVRPSKSWGKLVPVAGVRLPCVLDSPLFRCVVCAPFLLVSFLLCVVAVRRWFSPVVRRWYRPARLGRWCFRLDSGLYLVWTVVAVCRFPLRLFSFVVCYTYSDNIAPTFSVRDYTAFTDESK